ncbi:unnamed protein product [Sphagnum jensenii]|uniref:RNA helicase n=1 Tax=Sphagnum jensenii TaxID=128206 RepID=A0ABP1B3Z8_9BRYO
MQGIPIPCAIPHPLFPQFQHHHHHHLQMGVPGGGSDNNMTPQYIGVRPPIMHPFHLVLDQYPEVALHGLQSAFLTGEDLKLFCSGSLDDVVELTIAVGQSLSAKGSLQQLKRNNSASSSGASSSTCKPQGMTSMTLKTTNMHGVSHTLCEWMREFRGSIRYQEALKSAIESDPDQLARDKLGVCISNHIDFGLQSAGWATTSRNVPLSNSKVPPSLFRTIVVVNDGNQPVVLLDVCGIPDLEATLIHHDDYGLAHHNHHEFFRRSSKDTTEKNLELPMGVLLQPGAQYEVVIELTRSSYNDLTCSTPHKQQNSSQKQNFALHEQWLIFTFAKGDDNSSQTKNGKVATDLVFMIGRHVSALVVKHVQDVAKCLRNSAEVQPFYPLSVRTVFDTPPQMFSLANYACPSHKLMDMNRHIHPSFYQTGFCSIWTVSIQNLEVVLDSNRQGVVASQQQQVVANLASSGMSAPIKLLTQDTMNQKATQFPLSTLCSCYERQLRQLLRLLGLEEAAMERDIKKHDLLNVCLSSYQHNNITDVFKLEVPGLPENRPSVFLGDVVYVRWAHCPAVECGASVLKVESQPTPFLLLKLSPEFLVYQQPLQQLLVHVRFMIDRLIMKVNNRITPSHLDSFNSLVLERQQFVQINQSLNTEQTTAVKVVLDEDHGKGPYIIFGPPGTGKTLTVVETVLQVLKWKPDSRLCVCAPSNYAADILCSGIANGGIDNKHMWRLNDPRRLYNSVKNDVKRYCTSTNEVFNEAHPHLSILRVVVCTCAAAAFLHEEPLKSQLPSFSHILIDEAGQALIPEALIPLSLATHDTCYVLCGDPRQLGPVVHSKLASENGLVKSLLEHFMNSPGFQLKHPRGASSILITKLFRNYRANSKLLELPSKMFYGDELKAYAEETTVAPPRDWEEIKGCDFPLLFYGVKGKQMRERESPSYFNPVEIAVVVDLIDGLLKTSDVTKEDIGVMAPYRRQVYKLRLVLRSRGLRDIRVGTVDDYQGQEEKIIFISTVLTRPKPPKKKEESDELEQTIGFLGNAKRFNVAITRAKAMMVVVGHPVLLAADDNWLQLLKYCVSRGTYRGYMSDQFPGSSRSSLAYYQGAENRGDQPSSSSSSAPNDDDDIAKCAETINKLGEMSLLGMGDQKKIFPDSLDSYYDANSEDPEWQVRL